MKTLVAMFLVIGGAVLAWASAGSSSTQEPAATVRTSVSKPLSKEDIEKLRTEIRAGKSDVIAKNMSLTADEAAAFWPLYKQYEAATKALNDERFELLKKYVDAGEKADPALAAGWLRTSLKRDLDMAKLRLDWAPKFEKVLPKAKAIRFIQIDRALMLFSDAKVAAIVPIAAD